MASAVQPSPWRVWALGIALFAFIPGVLYLYVAHPRPVGVSLLAGVALMLGHRWLARPYMRWVHLRQCLWCKRVPPRAAVGQTVEGLELLTAAGPLTARCCAGHGDPAARFFAFAHAWRWPLRLGIFVPLALLLAALAAAALGHPAALPAATAGFRLAIGLTVNLAAWGYRGARPLRPARVPFPAHNFFLLGLRPLLWVLRLVGIWWIVLGAGWLLRAGGGG